LILLATDKNKQIEWYIKETKPLSIKGGVRYFIWITHSSKIVNFSHLS